MKKYLILFFIAFILTGCNNDDFNNETPYNATDIIGEWLFYEDINKSYVTNLPCIRIPLWKHICTVIQVKTITFPK